MSEGSSPASIGASRVVLLEVDSQSLFAHWEAREQALAAARNRLRDPAAKIVLRIEDLSLPEGGRPESFDLEVEAPRGERFFAPRTPFRTLRASLGVRSGEGRFATLALSNLVEPPRSGESELYEERFRGVRGSAAPPWERRAPARASPPADGPEGVPAAEAVVELSSEKFPHGRCGPEAGASPQAGDAAGANFTPPRFESCPPPSGPQAPFPGQDFIESAAPRYGEPAQGEPLTAVRPEIGISSPAVAFGASEAATSRGEAPPRDEIALDLRAEVVIYGRAHAGTTVFVGGARVAVRADGTFEARFALPPALPQDRGAGPAGGK